ncbi:helix-turn-helix domain-containing protein [Ruegeria sp. HKCCA5491]|uniref:helix-turn-helix domain-containing protein n=1 Tax=Ruegeria sp. HKCCA5491 TaxID=2682986 RepID=UPI0014877BD3|nr:helix-turn-helix domain-containing protein [Ruegeria sp. HKCCA5491]
MMVSRHRDNSGKRRRQVGASDPVATHKQARRFVWDALRNIDMNHGAQLVLLLMVSQWRPENGWRKGRDTIAKALRLSKDTVDRALRELQSLGLIYVVEPAAPRRPAVYDFGPNAFDLTDDEGGSACEDDADAADATPPDHQAETKPHHQAEYGATPPDHQAANGIRGVRTAKTYPSRVDQIDLSGADRDPVPWWSV